MTAVCIFDKSQFRPHDITATGAPIDSQVQFARRLEYTAMLYFKPTFNSVPKRRLMYSVRRGLLQTYSYCGTSSTTGNGSDGRGGTTETRSVCNKCMYQRWMLRHPSSKTYMDKFTRMWRGRKQERGRWDWGDENLWPEKMRAFSSDDNVKLQKAPESRFQNFWTLRQKA